MKSLLLLSLLLAPISAWAAPITVRVTDEAGAPIEGATVEVNRFDEVKPPYVVQTTDAQGLAKYDLGAASFDANFFGQALAWKAGRALGGGYLTNLKDGTFTLKLGATTAISGTIEDANGPVEGAMIQIKQAIVKQENGGNQSLQLGADSTLAGQLAARSDAKGQWTLQGVPADAPLELRVSGEKYATQIVRAPSGGAVKVSLRRGAALSGKVVGLDGAPLAGLAVYAQNQADKGSIAAQVSTDADGSYRFAGLEAGTYNVIFHAARTDNFVVSARENALATAGETRELETARAVAGVVVRGRVINAQSKEGVANIGVSVYGPAQPKSSGEGAPVATDKDGNFSARVAPGANQIALGYVPQQWVRAPQKFDLDVSADAETKPLIFELTPAISLRGRFVDENGQGVKTDLVIKQEYQEWPLDPNENGDFEVFTSLKGEVTLSRSMFTEDDEAPQTPWEVVTGGTFTLPSTEPVKIVVRRVPVGALGGSVEDETGAPIEGVKLNVSVNNGEGVGSTSQWKTLVSDAQGRFDLPNIRADQTVKLRGVEKIGYDLQSGGTISQNGINWSVQTVKMTTRRNQLAGRVTLANGAPASGAQVFAAGSETRADEKGAYVLKVLPAGDADIFVYADGQFAFRSAQTVGANQAATATDFKLAPQVLQPTDRELAGEMLARARVLAAQGATDVGGLKLNDADPVGALEALIAAPINDDQMSFAIYRNATNPDVSTPLLLRAVSAIKDVHWRNYAATMLFAKRPDWPDDDATRALADALMRDADAIAAEEKGPNEWASGIALMGIAPLIEKYRGEDAGAAALVRAIAWVKKQRPQPGNGYSDGYLSSLAVSAGSIAANSPALFSQLLTAIDVKTSPAYTRALQEGIVAIAKGRGLEATEPFLRQLIAAPTSRDDDGPDSGPGNSTNYAARPATREAIAAGGAKNPALALQLARGLGTSDNDGIENEGARALAEAAFFQPPDVAATLWREALPQLEADRAAQIAVRVAETQPALGRELLELARQKLDTSDAVNSWGDSNVASFAFYEAKFDAASARYRLEKAWRAAQSQSDDFQIKPDLVRAMSAIDGERAFEWASLLPAGDKQYGDARVDALRRAARYIEADERSRAGVDFERWKRDGTVFMD